MTLRKYAASCSEAHKHGVTLELNAKTCFSINNFHKRHAPWIKICLELPNLVVIPIKRLIQCPDKLTTGQLDGEIRFSHTDLDIQPFVVV